MSKTAAERQRECRERKRDSVTPENVTSVTKESECDITPVAVGDGILVQVGLDDYLTNPDRYITRREPDKLNWGPWMNSRQLEQAGLKGNRVTIPGDWDYKGVYKQVTPTGVQA